MMISRNYACEKVLIPKLRWCPNVTLVILMTLLILLELRVDMKLNVLALSGRAVRLMTKYCLLVRLMHMMWLLKYCRSGLLSTVLMIHRLMKSWWWLLLLVRDGMVAGKRILVSTSMRLLLIGWLKALTMIKLIPLYEKRRKIHAWLRKA